MRVSLFLFFSWCGEPKGRGFGEFKVIKARKVQSDRQAEYERRERERGQYGHH